MRISKRRRMALAAAAVFVSLSSLYLARTAILTAAGNFLRVEDPLAQADVIFVLAGEAYVRPGMASELHRMGFADRIVIARSEFADETDYYPNVAVRSAFQMQRLGVPRDHIVMLETPEGTTSTMDEARLFRDYADRHGVRRALVVTSEYHTRRTRWAMRRAFKGSGVALIMVPALEQRFRASNWWRSEAGILAYIEEYLKWLHNATLR